MYKLLALAERSKLDLHPWDVLEALQVLSSAQGHFSIWNGFQRSAGTQDTSELLSVECGLKLKELMYQIIKTCCAGCFLSN